jgi:hypothetical protein
MSSAPVPSMLSPRVLIPFMLTGMIWGSTWFVITGQIADVPAAWGVFYRFMLATPALFALALMMGNRLRLNRPEHLLALGVGIAQFSGNFLFVYHAEQHITSGIVAVMVALLPIKRARRRGCGSCRFATGMVAMVACAEATQPVATRSCCRNAPGISPPPRV